ncbi:hypothetical protein [Bacillus sp. 1P06AnD]|uniref:hypothetical protein n=1 Tax=Bacillus sp. 1P06AnD TaxID=3132208 RepID=UPI0039A00D73
MYIVKKGIQKDYPRIRSFIEKSAAIYDESCQFIYVEGEKGELLCVLGIQILAGTAFLRSFVFSPAFPIHVLPSLFNDAMGLVEELGSDSIYLASNHKDSAAFFTSFDFEQTDQENMPEAIKLSTAFMEFGRVEDVFFMCKTL